MSWSRVLPYSKNKPLASGILDSSVVDTVKKTVPYTITVKGTPVEFKIARNVLYNLAYSDLYYDRIHVIPSSVNFGVVDADKSSEVEIWNSFLHDNTMLNITGDFDQGLYFLENTDNIMFGGNTSKLYTLVADQEGVLTINASFVSNFTTSYGNLYAEGVREIVTFDFDIPTPSMSEKITFYTDILKSRDGAEQRIALLQNPRISTSYSYILSDYNLSLFDSKIEGFLGSEGLTPKWQQSQILNYEVLAGQNIVFFNTVNKDIQVGQYILLKEGNKLETAKVIELYDNRVVIELNLEKTFSEHAYVIPCFFAHIENVNKTNLTDRDTQVTVTFNYSVDEINKISYTAYSFEQYNSLNVFINQPNKVNNINTSYNRDTLIKDTIYGITSIIDINNQNFNTYNYSYLLDSTEEIQKFKSLLFDLNGRQKPFYIPTFQQDLILIEDGNFNVFDNTIVIQGIKYKKNYDKNFRDIIIFYKDGTHSIYKVIDSNNDEIFGSDDILILDRNLEKFTNYDNIEYISFLNKARFVSDDTTINFITNEVAEVVKNIQILKHEEK